MSTLNFKCIQNEDVFSNLASLVAGARLPDLTGGMMMPNQENGLEFRSAMRPLRFAPFDRW